MLVQTIKNRLLQERKARNAANSTLLTTLLAEVVQIGKNNGNRESTDDEAQKVIRKFIKNNQEFLLALEKSEKDSGPRKAELQAEIALLESFLPKQASSEELSWFIAKFLQDNPDKKGQIGPIMVALKAQFAGNFDSKLASELIKVA